MQRLTRKNLLKYLKKGEAHDARENCEIFNRKWYIFLNFLLFFPLSPLYIFSDLQGFGLVNVKSQIGICYFAQLERNITI